MGEAVRLASIELADQLARLASRAHPRLLIGCRVITVGDEFYLFPMNSSRSHILLFSSCKRGGAFRRT